MTKATPESSDSLVFECDFDEPPEKVWRALTEPQLLEAWLTSESSLADGAQAAQGADSVDGAHEADRLTSDRRVNEAGARPASSEPRRPAVRAPDLAILTAEPHRLLRYRWRDRENGVGDSGARAVDSVVTFELAPDPGGGTHLRLTHGEFRIVTVAQPMTPAPVSAVALPITAVRVTAVRLRPVVSARRRRRTIVSLAAPASLRQAA